MSFRIWNRLSVSVNFIVSYASVLKGGCKTFVVLRNGLSGLGFLDFGKKMSGLVVSS